MTVSAQRDPQALWRPLDPERSWLRLGERRGEASAPFSGRFYRGADVWAPESADPEVT